MLVAALVIPAARARAHRGGVDKLGCHQDRKNSGYHCHKGKLTGQSFPSKEAAQKGARWCREKSEMARVLSTSLGMALVYAQLENEHAHRSPPSWAEEAKAAQAVTLLARNGRPVLQVGPAARWGAVDTTLRPALEGQGSAISRRAP